MFCLLQRAKAKLRLLHRNEFLQGGWWPMFLTIVPLNNGRKQGPVHESIEKWENTTSLQQLTSTGKMEPHPQQCWSWQRTSGTWSWSTWYLWGEAVVRHWGGKTTSALPRLYVTMLSFAYWTQSSCSFHLREWHGWKCFVQVCCHLIATLPVWTS